MEMEIFFPGGKRVDAAVHGFTVKTDQPPSGGGEGSAPAPFTLFWASIGTCAGIYVLGFCQQRGLPTDNIRIRQSVEFDPSTRMAQRVKLDIDLPPDFPERYTAAVIRSAELCAVKKHLESPPEFSIQAHIDTIKHPQVGDG
jgi:ribosomal protein S12 methylthiotransferase accessory factor